MKIKLLDSVYNVETKTDIMAWDNHWNYQWSGRTSGITKDAIKWRKESDGQFIVCDETGAVWLVDQNELDNLLAA